MNPGRSFEYKYSRAHRDKDISHINKLCRDQKIKKLKEVKTDYRIKDPDTGKFYVVKIFT